ncbi:glycosyltransferase family 9 protein [Silvanigrella aquatica]|uniref:ADP-heptose--LPS heptosyltransferase n=1 Tax=Silvanigrella aquatica TaxID=1915309 RepID=A0A1L4D2A7_9BACT|nr:glycosyltransferase family 9 protein [Silvanigrella aquatica]APJ04327.1 hypothetical protein AXG55_10585 [Silvanigrella aquatica]
MQALDDLFFSKKHRIAIYHTGALGDLLVATAALFELCQLFSNSSVTVIGSGLWKEILNPLQWPQINSILEIKDKNFSKLKLWKANIDYNTWNEIPFSAPSFNLFLKDFHITIDFRSESLRFALKSFFSKIPMRVGAHKKNTAKILFTHFSTRDKSKEIHERDRYLDIIAPLNYNYIRERKEYWKKKGLPPLKWFPHDYKQSFYKNQNKKVILINPTASIREKAWASKNFRELAFKLKNEMTEVKIIGSPFETEWLKEVAKNDFPILQPQNILSLVDEVKLSSLLITNTSSMQFIAAGTHTPTLTLMGIASPERWGALGEKSYCLKNNDVNFHPKKFFISKKKNANQNESIAYNSLSVNLVFDTAQKFLVE